MNEISFKKTLSGRDEFGYTHERNDCAVRALSEALDILYPEAHAFWSKLGRKDKKGTFFRWLNSFLEKNNEIFGYSVKMTRIPYYIHETHKFNFSTDKWEKHTKRLNVKTFIKNNPTGRFIVLTRGHAKAIVNGVICDASKDEYSEIIYVYHFEKP